MKKFISEDRFELVIQPIINLINKRVVGCEVLSRLNHPERGTVYPGEFLKAIDSAGLYPEFDTYIFSKCCSWLRNSLECGRDLVFLSCNFSRKTLCEAGIAEKLAEIADSFGVNFGKIAIEITEQEQETDADLFCKNLIALKELGFRVFVDDMGSGVTSAEDLLNYPVDIVKIDRSMLVAAKTESSREEFQRLVNLALGLDALDCGCQYGQGFLFCAPMDADTFPLMLGRQV